MQKSELLITKRLEQLRNQYEASFLSHFPQWCHLYVLAFLRRKFAFSQPLFKQSIIKSYQKILINIDNIHAYDYLSILENAKECNIISTKEFNFFVEAINNHIDFNNQLTMLNILQETYSTLIVKYYFKTFHKKLPRIYRHIIKLIQKFASDDPPIKSSISEQEIEFMLETGQGYSLGSSNKIYSIFRYLNFKFILELAEQLGTDTNGKNKKQPSTKEIGITNVDNMYEILKNTNLGFNINQILKHQLALRHKSYGKVLFNLNYLEKKLLQFNYVSEIYDDSITPSTTEEIFEYQETGPVVLVIDTSGSMNGKPECIAKACAYQITKIANTHNRDVFLINFSDIFECYELTCNDSDNNNLMKFLSKSFRGGTNCIDPLIAATEVLKKSQYKNADVLLISDFIADFDDEEMNNAITIAKTHGNKFYGLVIDTSSNQGGLIDIEPFDCCYQFNGSKAQDKILYNELKKNNYKLRYTKNIACILHKI